MLLRIQEVGKSEINNRLQFLLDVGLGYLTLDRLSATLSGGESQRISLATSLGSSLVGSLYILDEPSIGLHSRDTDMLIKVSFRSLHLRKAICPSPEAFPYRPLFPLYISTDPRFLQRGKLPQIPFATEYPHIKFSH